MYQAHKPKLAPNTKAQNNLLQRQTIEILYFKLPVDFQEINIPLKVRTGMLWPEPSIALSKKLELLSCTFLGLKKQMAITLRNV